MEYIEGIAIEHAPSESRNAKQRIAHLSDLL